MTKVFILILTMYQGCGVDHILDYNLTGEDCLKRIDDFYVLQESIGYLSCQPYRNSQ